MQEYMPSPSPVAVVVGLCAHGLAIARALNDAGVSVTAIEQNSRLPGNRTNRCNEVILTASINDHRLIDALTTFAESLREETHPVLFLTNDNMVRIVGEHWDRLCGKYCLSWAPCRDRLLPLLDKSSLEAHCSANGLPYPTSRLLHSVDEIESISMTSFSFPAIVKPTRPLSGFKVRLIDNASALRELASSYAHALPFLIQQWIPGEDDRLFFTAFYLEEGRVLASYEGQKLGSSPPAQGQTTIAHSQQNPVVREIAERFFAPLRLSGPVSLEVKLDESGSPWIIEPTLGRTDYWLDCCVANGVNLPAVEFAHQTSRPLPNTIQGSRMIWFDTERAPLSYLSFRIRSRSANNVNCDWRPRFPYWGHNDSAPFVRGLARHVQNISSRVWRKLRARVG